MNSFNDKDYILFDGAFGTYYASLTDKYSFCENANIIDRETVFKIHKEYISSGAQAIKTNTFGANTISLKCQFDEIANIIRNGWNIAKEAISNSGVLGFADIGPILEIEGHDSLSEYKKIIDVFIECGASNFIFETFAEYKFLPELSAYIKSRLDESFIITSFAVDQDGYTRKGVYFKEILREIKTVKTIDSFGFNCICGPAHMCDIVSKIEINDSIISVMPNSGCPSYFGGRTVYIDNAQYFARKLTQLKRVGVRILGGCCGTTPLHIKRASEMLSKNEETIIISQNYLNSANVVDAPSNSFEKKLNQFKKVIIVEIDPPLNTNWNQIRDGARLIKEAGADALTVADSPLARARADSVIIASKLQREVDIQAIPHISCRDKNLIGIKASLIGASIEEIKNILIITGDPIAKTDRSEIKGVFSLNSSNLMKYITNLNDDIFKGNEMFIGGALNINVKNFDIEIKRADNKILNGAKFLLTQPAFSDEAVQNIKKARERLDVKILVGIMPLAGYRNAVFMNNEVPGINLPEYIIDAFKNKTPEEAEEISIKISMNTIDRVTDYCDGYYLVTPLKKNQLVCKIIKKIRSQIK